jgi:hypothetical protein
MLGMPPITYFEITFIFSNTSPQKRTLMRVRVTWKSYLMTIHRKFINMVRVLH